jgi:hypothetical protein
MLSFDERDLARRMRELAASIVVPQAPTLRAARGLHVNVLTALAGVMTIAIVIVTVAQLDGLISESLGPQSPIPSVGGSIRATSSASASPSASPTPSHRATPNADTPRITPGAHTVTGMVYELDAQGQRRPVAGVSVMVYLYGMGGGHWMTDVTDAAGRYELWGLPEDKTAVISAVKQGYVQPCGAWVLIAGSYVRDIEIVATSLGGAAATAAARRGSTPFLTGVVYEQRSGGARTPIANAMVTLGGGLMPAAATTVTDDLGRYLLCSVPAFPDTLSVTAPGYTQVPHFICAQDGCWNVGLVGDSTIVDVEMKR